MRRGWLVDQLPGAMAEDPFTRRFVSIFEEVGTGFRERIANVEHVLSTTTGTKATLRWMGSWLGVRIPTQLDLPVTRDLVAAAGEQMPVRGTVEGLVAVLEAACGAVPDVEESGGVYRSGDSPDVEKTVMVRLEDAGQLGKDGVLRLVNAEVPADVAVSVWVGDEQIFGPEPEETEDAEVAEAGPQDLTEAVEEMEAEAESSEPEAADDDGDDSDEEIDDAETPIEGDESREDEET